jgi:hypothetical protein
MCITIFRHSITQKPFLARYDPRIPTFPIIHPLPPFPTQLLRRPPRPTLFPPLHALRHLPPDTPIPPSPPRTSTARAPLPPPHLPPLSHRHAHHTYTSPPSAHAPLTHYTSAVAGRRRCLHYERLQENDHRLSTGQRRARRSAVRVGAGYERGGYVAGCRGSAEGD